MDEKAWQNKDNNSFYEAIKVDGLKEFAKKAGLDTGCDLDALIPYWSQATSVLDVGAGYGRAIDYLLKHNFQGHITAIERCNVLFDYLKNQFGDHDNVTLLHDDILFFKEMNQKFDLILMLWYGIADFSEKEQSVIFCKLKELIKKGGVLVIETLADNVSPLLSEHVGKKNYLIHAENAAIHVFLSNAYDIAQYAKAAKFLNVEQVNYKTDAQRERWLYIIR